MDSKAPNSEQLEEAAVRWFARRQSGTWSTADQVQFDAWLEASTAHRVHYIRVSTAWDNAARMKALGAGVPAAVIPPRGSWGDARFYRGASAETPLPPISDDSCDISELDPVAAEIATANPAAGDSSHRDIHPKEISHKDIRPKRRVLAIAATLLAAAFGLYFLSTGLFSGSRYSTPIGGLDNIPLADGSRITLNTDTSIRVAMSQNERRIQLDKGEAFFEVAKDKARPFVVYAGDKRVIAVGTKFSVRRVADGIQVVVTEGRVNLAPTEATPLPDLAKTSKANSPGSAVAPPIAGTVLDSTFLDAGDIARTSKSEVLVQPDAAIDTEKLLSWRRGYVNFDNVALATAVAEFNRYNTRKIIIQDETIAAIRISGNFRSNNSDAFLTLLQSGFPIVVERDDDHVILTGR